MYRRTILCLANSKKPPSGRCVAGKVFDQNGAHDWLRPVSSRETREVSEDERRYEGGPKAQLLDIIEIPLHRHEPLTHQIENHVLADGHYWVRRGRATWDQVRACLD